jgi:hypothetical protein
MNTSTKRVPTVSATNGRGFMERCAWAAVVMLAAAAAHAGTFTVTTNVDSPTATANDGSLRGAIMAANLDGAASTIEFNIPSGALQINLAAAASGSRMLPILTNSLGININGTNQNGGNAGNITIDGGSTSNTTGDRIFFVGVPTGTPAAGGSMTATTNTSYSFSNLTLQNANARGGVGGAGGVGAGGGGGGAGLGGAIFVNAGNVSVSGVTLSGNRAVGGVGGAAVPTARGGGGGGGMGGAGSITTSGGNLSGGGGFGIGANGSNGLTGSPGQFTGGANGGSAGAGVGGGNGGGGAAGGGGVGGGNVSGAGGGAGGFGGGGGAAAIQFPAGAGGYGGGGAGTNTFAGIGGFGGGGGGKLANATDAAGGFGAGAGGHGTGATNNVGGGGGGLGAGGAIFVRQGATLTITDGGISGGTVTGGLGGAKTGSTTGSTLGTDGTGNGSGLFLAGSASYSVSTGNTVTIADSIGGGVDALITGGFTKSGDGKLILTANNSYTGGTTISAGTLLANNTTGSGTGGGNVIVNGGTFGGTGSITGGVTVNAGGILAPGASIESLDIGALLLATATSHLSAEFDLGNTLAADLLNVTGAITLTNSILDLSLLSLPTSQSLPQTFLLVNNDGSDGVSGTFGTINVPTGFSASVIYDYAATDALGRLGDGNDIAVTLSAIAVPEPNGIVLFSIASIAVARRARRRSK